MSIPPLSVTRLTLDQEQALHHLVKTDRNLFITGGAGTGKSFLLRHYLNQRNSLKKTKIPVLASTGAAAIIVGGRTFHSFFGLGIMKGGPEATFQDSLKNKKLKKRLSDLTELIIDEVSMLSWETLDCAEKIARALRASDAPWGGIRMIAFGDFAQLPPVTRRMSEEHGGYRELTKPWAFLGESWTFSQFKKLELKEVMRTDDRAFLEVLNDVRWGVVSPRVRKFCEDQTRENVDSEITHLFPRRDQTEAFNLRKLADIETESRIYETIYSGASRYYDQLRRDAPIPEKLELKKGALVMIRMNDPRQRYVNGSIGRVAGLHDDHIAIELANRRVEIEPYAFAVQDADGNEVAFAKNFPVNLAYASTIHKIQGATLDQVHVDLWRLWEPGQAYVALSRARSQKGVTLMRWDASSIKADPMVLSFYKGEASARLMQQSEF